jgi:hypothetical protein
MRLLSFEQKYMCTENFQRCFFFKFFIYLNWHFNEEPMVNELLNYKSILNIWILCWCKKKKGKLIIIFIIEPKNDFLNWSVYAKSQYLMRSLIIEINVKYSYQSFLASLLSYVESSLKYMYGTLAINSPEGTACR